MSSSASEKSAQDQRTTRFLCLLSQCDHRLYAYVFSLVIDLESADEILQETKVKLWEEFDQFQPGTNFTAWALAIARYEVLSHRQRNRLRRKRLSDRFIETIGTEFTRRAESSDPRRAALGDCLATLDEPSRTFVLRCYQTGVQIQDIAQEIGRTVAATYQRLWRLRRTLHVCIDERLRRHEAKK